MLTEIDPYTVLGVAADASQEDIKNAYRKLARRLHPDHNAKHPGAGIQFADVTASYELLSDIGTRRTYDQQKARLPQGYKFMMGMVSSKQSLIRMSESQVVYLLAEIHADPRFTESTERDTRMNLTLVLDRSTSMNGARLERVRIAAHQIIDQLSPQDVLSVVSFSDRAELVIPATTVKDKLALKARVSMMNAGGSTEIYHGLEAGLYENRKYLGPKLINHIILLTDGNTYGDQERSIKLAMEAAKQGISISAMGLGSDWDEEFLDKLATKTGGASMYVRSAASVIRFLNEHVRNLSNSFAERMKLIVAPEADVEIDMAFKLAPHPQPMEVVNGEMLLGTLQLNRPIAVLLQLQLPPAMELGHRNIVRLVTKGDVLDNKQQAFMLVHDYGLEVTNDYDMVDPPIAIMDALSKLSLYRLQERAQEALANGDVQEATRRLENLATRLLELGHTELAQETLAEARRVMHTHGFSDKGRKTLIYQTRYLMLNAPDSIDA